MTEVEGAPLLSLESISRRFGNTVALDSASMLLRSGTVHALLGENGAGKTTLMRIAFGMLKPDGGAIRLRGKPVSFRVPGDALENGIGMVHQHFSLVPTMTVAENVALGWRGAHRSTATRKSRLRSMLFDPASAAARVHEIAQRAGLSIDPHSRIDSLSVAAQQRCEIIKALARDVDILILDEPTAVLAPAESAELLNWVRRRADAGFAVVLISHKLRDALAVADDVTVLRNGSSVYSARATETSERDLLNAMLGATTARTPLLPAVEAVASNVETTLTSRAASNVVPSTPSTVSLSTRSTENHINRRAIITLRNVSLRDARGVERVRGANLTVNAQEIVGIAAVEGAGQRELMRLLARRVVADSGDATINGSVGWIPEDRVREAMLSDSPLFENTALRGASSLHGRVAWNEMRVRTREMIRAFDVRAPSVDTLSRTLSGGNQQKFVLAREFADEPTVVIAENPTRGLDVNSRVAVHGELRKARARNAAIVIYSSDLDELLELCDRVYAMHAGRLTETAFDRAMIGRAMLGVYGAMDGTSST